MGNQEPITQIAEHRSMNVLIVYYSLYGHIATMAQAVAEGVHQVPGMTATLRRVPETVSASTSVASSIVAALMTSNWR